MNKSYMFDVVPSLSNKVVEVVPSMPSMVPAGSYTWIKANETHMEVF